MSILDFKNGGSTTLSTRPTTTTFSSVHQKRQETSTAEIVVETERATATATTTVVTSPLPSPFDSNLAATFNDNGECAKFINGMLTDSTFKSCYPFSLLIQGSNGFFEAEKSAFAITQVLSATCEADLETCAPFLNSLAEDLIKEENCKLDFEEEHQVALQAYTGLIAYTEMYKAACLRDENTGGFCFANAVSNYSNPSNTHLYYLPLNIRLPKNSLPSCNDCVQDTMQIFQSASSNRRLPIAKTYEKAATQINSICGSGFIDETLPVATMENAVGRINAMIGSKLIASIAIGVLILQVL